MDYIRSVTIKDEDKYAHDMKVLLPYYLVDTATNVFGLITKKKKKKYKYRHESDLMMVQEI